MAKLLSDRDRDFGESISRLTSTNPFLPERIACEKEALGPDYDATGAPWNTVPPSPTLHPNHALLTERCGALIRRVREAWPQGGRVAQRDIELYIDLVGFWLYQRYSVKFEPLIERMSPENPDALRPGFYHDFRDDVSHYLDLPGLKESEKLSAPHLFACVFQIRRAFHHVFFSLVGGSAPMARLRAQIWQSIFSHNLGRYRRVLFEKMGDFATLVIGDSGTGKELVARAISYSRYLSYNTKAGGFSSGSCEAFFPLNLSALSPTLIESELFGHRRGAFTGALVDRVGWMEQCPETGSVFLDEIGDVDAGIQVKLLRVLQSRTFQRLGDTETRYFRGKIIAATNQDLPVAIQKGQFREDFYYRLCSDLIRTPTLREQLDDKPEDLAIMVSSIVGRMVGLEEQARFSEDARHWIEKNLGSGYAWPGNFRELEQCVRNLLVRADYRPIGLTLQRQDWLASVAEGKLSAEQLLARYTELVFGQTGTIEETARRLELDRRTVRARLPNIRVKRGGK